MQPETLSSHAALFRQAAERASAALSKWLGRPARIAVRDVRSVPLAEAVSLLGPLDLPLAACAMRIDGPMEGVLLLACDDASGLALADLLLGQAAGTAADWGEVETSALVETANIIGCAYLNALAAAASAAGDRSLLPSPPWFARDYAGAIMETAVLPQATVADHVYLTHTDFTIEDTPITCSLLLVPAAATNT
jgi:chemotaxis protein CheC